MLIVIHSVTEAAKHLKNGALVIYPTETAYALGADATNKQAVAKVFALKERSATKALPVIVADMAMAERYVRVATTARDLAKQYWPGPLTMVLPTRKKRLWSSLRSTQALRVSDHALARSLSKKLGAPIVATSANVSGQGNTYSLASLKKNFGNMKQVVYVLGGETLPRRPPTTIVQPHGPHVRVLRQGSVHTTFL